jgi:hypothetical protein
MNRQQQKQLCIRELAKFLVENAGVKGISAPPTYQHFALEWRELRNASGIFGWPTMEQAVDHLTNLLS